MLSAKQKLFPLDKNYILKQAQEYLKEELLIGLVNRARQFYLDQHNPLGLVDPIITRILEYDPRNLELLDDFYFRISAVYRYTYGDNQLEILFDGRTHFEKYGDDWQEMFCEWTNKLFYNIHFLKAVLEFSVFRPEKCNRMIAGGRMHYFIQHEFNLKVLIYKGIKKIGANQKITSKPSKSLIGPSFFSS
jgi:hypothetical protein